MLTNIDVGDTRGIKWTKLIAWAKLACTNAGLVGDASDPFFRDASPGDTEGAKWAILQRWIRLLAEGSGGGTTPANEVSPVLKTLVVSTDAVAGELTLSKADGSYFQVTVDAAVTLVLGSDWAAGDTFNVELAISGGDYAVTLPVGYLTAAGAALTLPAVDGELGELFIKVRTTGVSPVSLISGSTVSAPA